MSIDLFTTPARISSQSGARYELLLPDETSKMFGSLCEVLAFMNDGLGVRNQLAGKTQSMEIWTTTGHSIEVVQRSSSFGVVLLESDGTAQEILECLFAEVAAFSFHPNGKPKQPWEMTRNQWNAVHTIGSICFTVVPCLSREHLSQTCVNRDGSTVSLVSYMDSEFLVRYGYGHNGPFYSDGRDTNSRHDVHVMYALGRGDSVPEVVLQDYRENRELAGYEPDLLAYLDKPYLVGRISSPKLRSLIHLLKSSNSDVTELTEENYGHLVALANSVQGNVMDLDNLLYARGIVKARTYSPPEVQIGEPYNAFAASMRDEIIALLIKNRTKALKENMERGFLTNREYDFQKSLCDQTGSDMTFDGPNRFAKAIENQDVDALISYLDSPSNEATKKAIATHYAIQLTGVTAAQRRRGIFALAGYATDAQYQEAEAAYKQRDDARNVAKAERKAAEEKANRLPESRAVAQRKTYNWNGKVVDGAAFIDGIVGEGFTSLEKRKHGAVGHWMLVNPGTKQGYKLKAADGVVEYAKALLESMETSTSQNS